MTLVFTEFGLNLSRILRIWILKLVRCSPRPSEHFSRQNVFNPELGTPWIPKGQPLSLSKTQRNPRTRERRREKKEKKEKKKNWKRTMLDSTLYGAPRRKRKHHFTKSRETWRSVCCWLFGSARAVGHPSERFKCNSPVSTFLDPYLLRVTSKGIQPYTQSS